MTPQVSDSHPGKNSPTLPLQSAITLQTQSGLTTQETSTPITQPHLPTFSDAVIELNLSNLGTFTTQNTITIQGEITEVAVSAAD